MEKKKVSVVKETEIAETVKRKRVYIKLISIKSYV